MAAGTAWVIAWRMATRLLGLLSTLILVRALTPADFGLVALGTGFIQAVEWLSWLGVEDGVIREKNPGRDIYDTGFTITGLSGLATGVVIMAAALPAGRFFHEPRLSVVLAVLAVGSVAEGFTNIGTVDFRRDFAFDKEFRFWILPRICGMLTTISVAVIFHSYWAMVAGILVNRCLRVVFSYVMHPYRPRFTLRAWRKLIGYSLWTWMLGMASLARDRCDTMLIGRMLGATEVGIYAVGMEVASLPSTELIEPLCRAAFSGFSAARHESTSLGDTYLRIVATTAVVTLPAGLGISLVAAPVVRLVLGPTWTEAIPLLQVLALAGTTGLFGWISLTLFRAHGLMVDTVRITLAAVVLRIGLIILGIRAEGLLGAAIGAGLAIVAEQAMYVARTCRHFGLRLRDLAKELWRVLAACTMMAAVLQACGYGWASGPQAGDIVLPIGIGMISYVGVLSAAWLAAGRPAGAETDMLGLVTHATSRLRSRLGAG